MEVIGPKGFCDVSLINQPDECLKSSLNMLVSLGYKTVAINYTVDESIFKRDKKKKEAESDTFDIIPPPKVIVGLKKEFEGKLKIYQRITVTLSDKDQAHKLSQSENLLKYNLIAVIPTTDVSMQYACADMKVDIISFDPMGKKTVKTRRNMYKVAVERGVYFELMYAPAIQDTTCRKNIIHLGHMYLRYGKSKNIIISSAASEKLQIRGPYDIINLGLLFGLSEEQAKNAITSHCRSLLLNAAGRCAGQAVVLVKRKHESSESEDEDEFFQNAKRMEVDNSDSKDST